MPVQIRGSHSRLRNEKWLWINQPSVDVYLLPISRFKGVFTFCLERYILYISYSRVSCPLSPF